MAAICWYFAPVFKNIADKFLMKYFLVYFFQNVKAKAVYDNIAETVDELAFRKGEILDVIEQNTDGLDGWWLCSLRDRKGICPGNRLKVIDFETGCYTPSPLASPCSTSMSMSASTLTFSSQLSQPSELYENTSNKSIKGKRRSWHIMPNRVSRKYLINMPGLRDVSIRWWCWNLLFLEL